LGAKAASPGSHGHLVLPLKSLSRQTTCSTEALAEAASSHSSNSSTVTVSAPIPPQEKEENDVYFGVKSATSTSGSVSLCSDASISTEWAPPGCVDTTPSRPQIDTKWPMPGSDGPDSEEDTKWPMPGCDGLDSEEDTIKEAATTKKSPKRTVHFGFLPRPAALFGKEPTTPLSKEPRTPQSVTSVQSMFSMDSEKWSAPSETLIFLDWDDTLCPTTSCAHLVNKVAVPSAIEKEMLSAHELAVIDFLRRASELGHCAIVTMALSGWVQQCIAKLMPAVGDVLKELQIEIVSARDSLIQRIRRGAFSDDRDPSQYLKTKAMQRLIKQFYKGGGRMSRSLGATRPRSWKNIVSIGDSECERLALQDLVFQRGQWDRKGEWSECRCKTLLLLDAPGLDGITKEVRCMTAVLASLVSHDGDIHVDIHDDDLK